MKIVNVIGGLGNQMFQYAFAIGLKSEFPKEEVKINTLCFRGYSLHNGYELNKIFNITLGQATVKDLLHVAYPWSHYRLWQIGNHCLPLRKSMIIDTKIKGEFNYAQIEHKSYFDGYWQSERFFRKHRLQIIEAYKFPKLIDLENISLEGYLKKKKVAFIHIRRGDYNNDPTFGGVCTLEYYKKGIEILKKQGFSDFLVFSNDIEWSKENLRRLLLACHVTFVDWNNKDKSYIDMYLMTLCRGGLIANSSFSWWGAWLGNMELVIAPKHWTNYPYRREDIFPDSWIRI